MYKSFRPRLRSRHPSHSVLRPRNKNLPLFPFKSVIRLGSSTDMKDTVTNGGDRIEINTIDSIKNSSNKLLMKQCFTKNKVKTANWWRYYNDNIFYNTNQPFDESFDGNAGTKIEDLPYPIISKNVYGSRGRGNKKHDNLESLEAWMEGKDLSNYIFEKFHNYAREYRIHVTEDGYFYTCRKVLRRDTPSSEKWYRNDSHCNWIREDGSNPELFDKPVNWDEIEEQCVNALMSVGLDLGAVDLRIQSATHESGEKRDNPNFIVVEINSAPSLGNPDDPTSETFVKTKYLEEIPKILMRKYHKNERT